MSRASDNQHKYSEKITLGMSGTVEFIDITDPDNPVAFGDATEYQIVTNKIKPALRNAFASLLAGQPASLPGWIAVGTGATASYPAPESISFRAFTDDTFQWFGQFIDPTVSGQVAKIVTIMRRIGFSAATVTVEIQEDDGGEPSGTPITNGVSLPIAMNGLSTDVTGASEIFEFDLGSFPELDEATDYWLVFKPSNDYVYDDGVTEIMLGSHFLDATEDTARFWDGANWSAFGDDSAYVYSAILAFDDTRSDLVAELDRNPVSASNPAASQVRYVTIFGPSEAVGYIAEVGLFDAATSGNLMAYATANRIKTAQRVLMVIWTITIIEVES